MPYKDKKLKRELDKQRQRAKRAILGDTEEERSRMDEARRLYWDAKAPAPHPEPISKFPYKEWDWMY